ncbi:MAG: hypothetical protein AAB650_02600 [Patescibacteria group bacterium]
MNPIAIIGVIIALIIAYFSFSGSDFLGGGGGPIATGPGGSEVRNPQPVSRGGGFFFSPTPSPEPSVLPQPGVSPWRGKVRLSTVQRFSERTEEEYAIIRSSGGFFGFGGSSGQGEPVDITGWSISSLKSSATIPRAFNIPEIDAAEQDIFLAPGGELIIVTGTPTYQRNFRENQCVGYLSQSNIFTPSLYSYCPDSRPNRQEFLNRGFSGVCIDFIERIPTCRMPAVGFDQSGIGRDCAEYVSVNFNYVGCVKNSRDKKDFLSSTWRVSLKRGQKLFDSRHDRVTLRDKNGLTVDEFEY